MCTKTCTYCNEDKPATIEFFRSRGGGKSGFKQPCRECQSEGRKKVVIDTKRCPKCKEVYPKTLQYFMNNDGKGIISAQTICIGCKKQQLRSSRLRHSFGISQEEYDTFFVKQGGCCAICGRHQNELAKILNVDHDHSTKEIRGLLCNECNLGLGLFYDSKDKL